MMFALSPEQQAFAASLDDLLRSADTPSVVRAWAAGDHSPGLALWRRLAELGVHGLLVDEEHGGLGADAVDLAVAFEVLGYHAVPGPLVESVAVLPVLLSAVSYTSDMSYTADDWLSGLAGGELVGTVAAPPLVPYALDADTAGLRLQARGVGGELHSFAAGSPLSSVDPARRLSTVDDVQPLGLTSTGAAGALDHGVLAVAAQLLGAGRRLLDDSVQYALQRQQYGRPIGQNQAIKHLLADVAVGLELARPLVHGAAVTSTPRDISAARVACADAAYRAARAGLQVHGAIGYTAEHDLGLWLTKVRALRAAWGSQAFHRQRVLDALVAGR